MNSDAQKQIDPMDFASRFFKAWGGVVENHGERKDILLPGETARALETEEIIQVESGEAATKKAPGASNVYTMQLHTPLLDRMLALAGAAPPFARAELKFDYIKTQGFDRLIAEQFEFHKAKAEVMKTGEARTRYLALTCRFTAQSDEIKQGLVDICFNLDTDVVIPEMPDSLVHVQKDYLTVSDKGCSDKEIENVYKIVRQYGKQLVENRLSSFIDSMNRRFKRDATSLDEYYAALEKEMEESLDRSGLSDRLVTERREKIAMLPGELAAKKKDLRNKYSINIDFKPVAALYMLSPCVTVFTRLISGHKKKDLSLTYNPVTKKMDPVVCQSCGAVTYSMGCDQNLRIKCPACL